MSEDVRPWVLVPAKGFSRAKSRLSPALEPAERATLARRMLENVVRASLGADLVAKVAVTTDDDEVSAAARGLGAEALRDGASGSLGDVVDRAIVDIARCGARSVIVLMSDLPLLEPSDVADLARLLADHDVVIAPDSREGNTNALALASLEAVHTAFGSGNSFRTHLDGARAASKRVVVHRSRGLALDVDVPDDLESVRARL